MGIFDKIVFKRVTLPPIENNLPFHDDSLDFKELMIGFQKLKFL